MVVGAGAKTGGRVISFVFEVQGIHRPSWHHFDEPQKVPKFSIMRFQIFSRLCFSCRNWITLSGLLKGQELYSVGRLKVVQQKEVWEQISIE